MEETENSHNVSQDIVFDDDEDNNSGSELNYSFGSYSSDDVNLSSQLNAPDVPPSRLPPPIFINGVVPSPQIIDLQSSLEELNVTFSSSQVTSKTIVRPQTERTVSGLDEEEIFSNYSANPNIFGPPVELPVDNEKIQKVFLTTGFVTAKKFQQIEKKIEADEFDDDFESEATLNEVKEIEKNAEIDNSISVLSRSLHSSQILQSSNNRFDKGIEISQTYEDIDDEFDEEPDEVKDTEAMENSLMRHEEYDESIIGDSDDELNSTFIKTTDDMERSAFNFDEFSTQKPQEKPKIAAKVPPQQIFMGFRSAKSDKPLTATSNLTNIQKKFALADETIQKKLKDQKFDEKIDLIPFDVQTQANKTFSEIENLELEVLNDLETQLEFPKRSIPTATQQKRDQEFIENIINDFVTEDFMPISNSPRQQFPIDFGGFKTAKGTKLTEVNNKDLIDDFYKFDEKVMGELCNNAGMPMLGGFKSAAGKKMEVKNKNILKKQLEKFEKVDNEKIAGIEIDENDDIFAVKTVSAPSNNPIPAFGGGFTFASGKPAKAGDAALRQIELYKELDKKFEAEIENEEFSFKTPVAAKEFFHSRSRFNSTGTPGTSKASTSNAACKKSLLEFIKECENEDEVDSPHLPLPNKVNRLRTTNIADTPPPLKRARLEFGGTPTTTSSSPFLMRKFEKGIAFHSTSTPVVSRREIVKKNDASSHLQIDSLLNDSSVTMANFAVSPSKRNKLVKMKLDEKFSDDDDDDICSFSAIDAIEQIVSRMPRAICEQRQLAMKNQLKEIEEKADYDRRAMTGSVFMKKSCKNRMSLVNYVKSSPSNLHRHNNMSLSDAIKFKFSMENYPEYESTSYMAIEFSVADNAKLILNDLNQVGINEISSAFLASPGVDPSLISPEWIENAFKFIIVKFVFLENSFDDFNKFELLSPENVLLQLKYRYDREIDRSHRSAIKKIVELDDVATRRMVLRVEEIHESATNAAELTLSDGWYKIRARIDSPLDSDVECGRIQVGSKLITSYAEIIGAANGFDPLDMPSSVYLKIHANSTRNAAWHEQMGFCPNPYPIAVNVGAVKEAGGVIGRLKFAVVHVYDVMYAVDGAQKEFISERVFNRIQEQQNIKQNSLGEVIAHQKENERIKLSKSRVLEEKLNEKKLIDCSATQLYDLVVASGNDDVVNELTQKTRRKLQDISYERQLQLNDEVTKSLGEQTKNFTRILRFRIIDAVHPNKTALVSWWSPSDEVIGAIQVGKQFEMFNSHPAPLRDEIQIKATSSTNLKPITKPSTIDLSRFTRKITEISDICQITATFNPTRTEFDIICIVVKIEPEAQDDKLQRVLVSDENFNFIFINFWTNLSNYAMSNLIEVGKVFHMKNLQWRKAHPQKLKFKQVFMQLETSNLVEHPKSAEIESQLKNFRDSIGSTTEFVDNCNKIINDEIDVTIIRKDKENLHNNSIKSPSKGNISKSTSLPFDFKTPSTSARTRLGMARAARSSTRPTLRSNVKRTRVDYASLSMTKKRKF